MHSLFEWTKTAVIGAGPWGLFVLAFSESSFFPIPPDLLLIAMVLAVPEQAFFLAGVAMMGSVLGACFGYALGHWGGRPLLERFVRQERIRMVQDQFQRYDAWAIGIAGFTPIPYKIFTVSAGVFKLNFWRFVAVSILARGGRFFLVASVLYWFGPTAKDLIGRYFNIFSIVFILLLIAGFWFVGRMGKRAVRNT